MEPELLKRIVEQIDKDAQKDREHFEDLTNNAVFNQHAELVVKIANMLLAPQRRKFVVDDRNTMVLYFCSITLMIAHWQNRYLKAKVINCIRIY